MLRTAAVLILAAGVSLLSVTPATAAAPTTGGCPVPFTLTTQGPIDDHILDMLDLDVADAELQAMLDASFDFIDQNGDEQVCWDKRTGKRGTILENRAQNP